MSENTATTQPERTVFQVGDRIRASVSGRGSVFGVVLNTGDANARGQDLVVRWDDDEGDSLWFAEARDTVLFARPEPTPQPVESRYTRDLLGKLRTASLAINSAMDHATRALSGDPLQVKNRHETLASDIARATAACADAAWALAMEPVTKRGEP